MLKKIIDKRNYIILLIIIILIIWIIFPIKKSEYIKSYHYFNDVITIKIYSKKNMNKVLKNIDIIYNNYNKCYKKNNCKEIINDGKKIYNISNKYVDISNKQLVEKVKQNKTYNYKTQINNLNKKNINLDLVIGSYATSKVIDYLKKEKINEYIISTFGDISCKKHYNNKKYKISITDNQNSLKGIVYIKNNNVVTRGNVNEFKSYMVNPLTHKKQDDKLVVVIDKNLKEANIVADAIYLMDINDAKKYLKKFKAEALIITKDKKFQTTNFNKYFKENKQ